jgi:hypothetical protein
VLRDFELDRADDGKVKMCFRTWSMRMDVNEAGTTRGTYMFKEEPTQEAMCNIIRVKTFSWGISVIKECWVLLRCHLDYAHLNLLLCSIKKLIAQKILK